MAVSENSALRVTPDMNRLRLQLALLQCRAIEAYSGLSDRTSWPCADTAAARTYIDPPNARAIRAHEIESYVLMSQYRTTV